MRTSQAADAIHDREASSFVFILKPDPDLADPVVEGVRQEIVKDQRKDPGVDLKQTTRRKMVGQRPPMASRPQLVGIEQFSNHLRDLQRFLMDRNAAMFRSRYQQGRLNVFGEAVDLDSHSIQEGRI